MSEHPQEELRRLQAKYDAALEHLADWDRRVGELQDEVVRAGGLVEELIGLLRRWEATGPVSDLLYETRALLAGYDAKATP